ncbi:MAG: HAD family hydrolase [Oscillospiraceae bacterium]|nr:HAD family hydrolase [Oscillospiraceae bacterium]
MKRPKMILFDYRYTLVYKHRYDVLEGMKAILSRAEHNPLGVTAEEMCVLWRDIFSEIGYVSYEGKPSSLVEVRLAAIHYYVLEYYAIKHRLSFAEMEEIFWEAASAAYPTKNAEKLLEYLKKGGIRTGVVSNDMVSGAVLKKQINRMFRGNTFEFVYSSGDFMLRKPAKRMFELAIRRSGLQAEEIIHCGSSAKNDCMGASNAGIFPIWYTGACRLRETRPVCRHIEIADWEEFIELIENSGEC